MKKKIDTLGEGNNKKIVAVHLTAQEETDCNFLLALSLILKENPDMLADFLYENLDKYLNLKINRYGISIN